MPRTVVPVTNAEPTAASLTTALAGANNDLVFTAKDGGQWGNSIQVEYIDPGGTSATLAVSVLGFVVSVSLGRAASAIDTTASALKTAVEANLDAAKLVSVALAGVDDGTGLVTALAVTALAGGTYSVAQPALTNGDATNDHYFTGNDGQVVLEAVSTDAGAQTVTLKRSPTLRVGSPPSDEVVTLGAGATVVIGPFPTAEFNQNSSGDVYFDPSVSNTIDFRAYRVERA